MCDEMIMVVMWMSVMVQLNGTCSIGVNPAVLVPKYTLDTTSHHSDRRYHVANERHVICEALR